MLFLFTIISALIELLVYGQYIVPQKAQDLRLDPALTCNVRIGRTGEVTYQDMLALVCSPFHPRLLRQGIKPMKIILPHPKFQKNNLQRIVNGQPARLGQFPYQATLTCLGFPLCGGTIYNAKTVITAAHCCFEIQKKYSNGFCVITVGTVFPNGRQAAHQRQMTKMIYHPNFIHVEGNYSNDICIVITDRPFEFNNLISPLPLGDEQSCRPGQACQVAGFGAMKWNGFGPNRLLYTDIPLLDDKDCFNYKDSFDAAHMICAGYLDGSRDTCSGDSGGPLQCNKRLCGVVSFGEECARPGFPGVYVKISKFANWIKLNAAH